jgi:hypothetical protein
MVWAISRTHHQFVKSPELARINQIMTNWSSGPFLPIEQPENVRAIFSARVADASLDAPLTAEQKQKLNDSMCSLLAAYNSTNFDVYLDFRLPLAVRNDTNAYGFDQKVVKEDLNMLPSVKDFAEAVKKAGADASLVAKYLQERDVPLFVLRKYREILDYDLRHEELFSRLPCATCWTGFNPDSARIHVGIITNQESIETFPVLTGVTNLGFTYPEPSVIFKPSLRDLVYSDGSVTVASILLNVRTEHRDVNAYPISVAWYWDPRKNAWLPFKMVVCCTIFQESMF